MSEILTLCNRIVVLKKGVLKFKGTIDEAKVMYGQRGMKGIWKDEEVIYQLLLDE